MRTLTRSAQHRLRVKMAFNHTPMSPRPLTFGSLFAGIGGFDLGFERSGMRCEWQVEIDPYCQRVLAKHWPTVRRWGDVRTFPPSPAQSWRVDVICGGFPCINISSLGDRAGIVDVEDGSGLWREAIRIIRILRPPYIIVENVAEILFRGAGDVLGDMAESRYDSIWQSLPAASFGAPHYRDRFFALGVDRDTIRINGNPFKAFSEGDLLESGRNSAAAWRETESKLDRVSDGVPSRVDRIRCLGNAVVPQVAEYIGKQLLAAIRTSHPLT